MSEQTPREINLHGEGGPAFPVSIPGCGDNGWHGMTLRDWLAGQAIQGLVQRSDNWPESVSWTGEAATAYAIADAMLGARASKAEVISS